ncbi:MAG TPA: DUF4214 domain-containing protein [Pyrinomonadaceae bacterium]|nr:DUF4214 domain-containing protein [Pyrinomonadaceae bacterium]
MKFAVVLLAILIMAGSVLGQTQTGAPTLRIVTEDPNLPSELYYGDVKVKPLRLRPGTNQVMGFWDNDYFVYQQYIDFLGRQPDEAGYNDWLSVLNNCTNKGGLGADIACDRVHVSSGFFRSPEFSMKGQFVYRFYEAALGRLPKYVEWKADTRPLNGLSQGAELEAKQAAYAVDFASRPEFTAKYGTLTQPANAKAFVEKLMQTSGITSLASKETLISQMQSGQKTAAQTLRAYIETKEIWDRFFYRGFVTMQYFGYLKRDPDQAGWTDWVDVLENGRPSAGIAPGDYRHLIFGFVYSVEYRERF